MKFLNINNPRAVCHSALDAESRLVRAYSGGGKSEIATLPSVARNDRNKVSSRGLSRAGAREADVAISRQNQIARNDKKKKGIAVTNQRNTIEASCEVLIFPSP